MDILHAVFSPLNSVSGLWVMDQGQDKKNSLFFSHWLMYTTLNYRLRKEHTLGGLVLGIIRSIIIFLHYYTTLFCCTKGLYLKGTYHR
jgi:hypothetical protein